MDLDFALVSFEGINSAAEEFAAARDRSGAGARWAHEVGFVEHHEDGHLVLRGTFAGHYVDVDEALHFSGRGAGEGWLVGAVIGVLGGPPGLAAGSVLGVIIGSQVGTPTESDPEPQRLVDPLRSAVPRSGSAIVLIAAADAVDEMLAAVGEDKAQVTHRTLTSEEAAALEASLRGTPAASPGPSVEGEEAAEGV
jgi:uncharacterized membrane protein